MGAECGGIVLKIYISISLQYTHIGTRIDLTNDSLLNVLKLF